MEEGESNRGGCLALPPLGGNPDDLAEVSVHRTRIRKEGVGASLGTRAFLLPESARVFLAPCVLRAPYRVTPAHCSLDRSWLQLDPKPLDRLATDRQ